MSEYRITGKVGPGGIACTTEWLNEDEDDPDGVKIGFEMRGWADVEIEYKDEHHREERA